jgi:hypothetical protein
MDAFVQGVFLGGNDDLDSFFTPNLDGPTKDLLLSEDSSILQGQWDNGTTDQMLDSQQGFPFREQELPMQQCSESSFMMSTSCMESRYTSPAEIQPTANMIEEQPHSLEEPGKPKQGRHRKRKRKDPLSEEEQRQKREAFPERNRRAASKCRKRRKESIGNIQTKANNLDRQCLKLTAELLHIKVEHAKLLNLAMEHAKLCPDDPAFKDYSKAAEIRPAEFLDFVPMGRIQEWDGHLASTIDHENSSVSGSSMSPGNTSNLLAPQLEYFV